MATLPQGDGHAWPAFAGSLIGGERHGQVLDIRYRSSSYIEASAPTPGNVRFRG
jgi:hypothetical protein